MNSKIKFSEKDVKKAVLSYLDAKKHLYFVVQNQGQYDPRKGVYHRFKGTRGAPDLMVHIGAGVWYCIELKSSTGRQSKDQREFQKKVEEKHGDYYIVRNINDLIQIGL